LHVSAIRPRSAGCLIRDLAGEGHLRHYCLSIHYQ
jgi:hypothetical protein